MDGLRRLWVEAGSQRREWDAEAALRRIKQVPSGPLRVIRLPAYYRAQPMSVWQRVARASIGAAAAAAVVAVGVTLSRTQPEPAPQAPAVFELSTTRGQRASLRLSDGSQVMLGPLSSIRYTAAPGGPRTVHLSGQALFTVTHDSARLFAVHTPHGTATDLGTQFVVRSYPGDSTMVVAVVEGEVSLRPVADTLAGRAAADSLLLRAGDRGRATAIGKLAIERGVDLDRYLAWSEGRLEFRSAPMRDVVAELARWYDLEIRLANGAVARRRLTASFNDESIDEVLRLIRASLDVRTERAGRVVTIGPH
jgi:transmembrane sensor